MNLVGKIFVSLIAIMSIIFFSLSLTLYANHKNWKEDSAAKQERIAQLDKEKSTLTAQKQDLENKIVKEREAYEATIGALHDVVQDLQVQNDRPTTWPPRSPSAPTICRSWRPPSTACTNSLRSAAIWNRKTSN